MARDLGVLAAGFGNDTLFRQPLYSREKIRKVGTSHGDKETTPPERSGEVLRLAAENWAEERPNSSAQL
jgi:hypothetical protein